MNTMRKQGGFTLIELMIVIAILAILIAIAVPAYQDYSVRAQNSECMNIAAGLKLSVAETAQSNGDLVGASDYNTITVPSNTDICTGFTVNATSGLIEWTSTAGPGGSFDLEPEQTSYSDAITWTCSDDGSYEDAQLPAECRTAAASN